MIWYQANLGKNPVTFAVRMRQIQRLNANRGIIDEPEDSRVNLMNFIAEYPCLKYQCKELLGFHYGLDIFNAKKAKAQYPKPDLVPFD